MGEWKAIALNELADIVTGGTPKASESDSWGDEVDFITPSDQGSGRSAFPERRLSPLGAERMRRRVVPPWSTALTCIGATIGKVTMNMSPAVTNQQINTLIARPGIADPRFVYYAIRNWSPGLKAHASGSATPIINKTTLGEFVFTVPPLEEQRAIAEVLGSLDDKIAANDRVIATADELAQATLASGLAVGGREIALVEVAEFHNRRRIPLSSRDREERVGDVPYYGAASRMDFVDTAIFDEQLVLVGEDGSVIREDGSPVVQYIWGPSWVNNHAHVLTGVGISTELLRHAIRRSNVAHLVTGAVQPKISMGNLKRLDLQIPTRLEDVDARLQELSAVERALTEENERLVATREELLPLLMSGKLRVTDIGAAAPA